MGSNEEMVLATVQSAIFTLSQADQEIVEECASIIRHLVAGYDWYGKVALALVGAENSAEVTSDERRE